MRRLKNHPCSSIPRTPSGFCKSCDGPAPNPSSETENAATLTLPMLSSQRFCNGINLSCEEGVSHARNLKASRAVGAPSLRFLQGWDSTDPAYRAFFLLGCEEVERPHPFAQNAKGWGTLRFWGCRNTGQPPCLYSLIDFTDSRIRCSDSAALICSFKVRRWFSRLCFCASTNSLL